MNTALRHASFANERGDVLSNERLEFLGDSVLGLAIAQLLYEARPDASEGELSMLKAELVCEKALSRRADALGLSQVLSCGKSMRGGVPPSLYADALEAVLGAVFMDGGYEAAECVVKRWLFRFDGDLVWGDAGDAKSRLQAWLQARDGGLPNYELLSVTGPCHAPVFRVRVRVGNVDCVGVGSNRKTAELSAASLALKSCKEAEE